MWAVVPLLTVTELHCNLAGFDAAFGDKDAAFDPFGGSPAPAPAPAPTPAASAGEDERLSRVLAGLRPKGLEEPRGAVFFANTACDTAPTDPTATARRSVRGYVRRRADQRSGTAATAVRRIPADASAAAAAAAAAATAGHVRRLRQPGAGIYHIRGILRMSTEVSAALLCCFSRRAAASGSLVASSSRPPRCRNRLWLRCSQWAWACSTALQRPPPPPRPRRQPAGWATCLGPAARQRLTEQVAVGEWT